MEVAIETFAGNDRLTSRGVHLGAGWVVSTIHGTRGQVFANGHECWVARANERYDLVMMTCPGLHYARGVKFAYKRCPDNARYVPLTYRGHYIEAFPTGRRSRPGRSGSGYYENRQLCGIVIAMNEDKDDREYAVRLDRILAE